MKRRRVIQHRGDDASAAQESERELLGDPFHGEDFSPSVERWILPVCVVFRLLNALLLQTFFNPDEYWQSAEVAHRIVFGYGHLTWEWTEGIRSYLHPLIFASLYKALQLMGLDSRWLVMKTPRLLQALFAAVGDYYLFKLAKHFWGENAARWTIFCQLSNWFTFFCIVRTFSNSLETVLTLVALYYWLSWKVTSKEPTYLFTTRQIALFLAAVSCAIRPTGAILWIYIGLIELLETDKKIQLLLEVFFIGSTTIGANCIMDKWMYGRWILVPINFLRFNFLSGGGDYYGTHPWHWYFTQGFPAMLLTFMPLSILGIWWSKHWKVAGIIGWVLSFYSFLGHKEFRFVLPVLPLGLMFAGYTLSQIVQPGDETKKTKSVGKSSKMKPNNEQVKARQNRKQFWQFLVITGLLLTNIPTALYMSLVHQRGSEAVMHFLAKEIQDGHVDGIFFLMACHNTPYYSFLHVNVTMGFLDCSPSDQIGYIDESDRFQAAPDEFVRNMFKDQTQLPSHVVFFDSLDPKLVPLLRTHGYEQAARIFHAHFAVDHHGLQRYILVYHLTNNTSNQTAYR